MNITTSPLAPLQTWRGEKDPTPSPSPNKERGIEYDVSVVIPAYQPRLDWLIRAVDSCLKQDVRVEVIVVYDGEPTSGVWLPERDHVRVLCIEHQGPAAALNAGMDVASGEYRMILGDDDYFEPNVFGKLLEAASPMFFAYGDVNVPLGVHHTPESPEPHARGEALRTGYAVMWHRRAWDAGLRYYTPMLGYPEDHDWVLQLERLGMRGLKVPITVWNYRERPGGRAEMLRQNWDEAYRILWDRFDKGYEWEPHP